MIGYKLSPILEEIENALCEYELRNDGPPCYTEAGFRAAAKIFMNALMDKMWVLQCNEATEMGDREQMARKAGQDLRKLVKTYTDIDTHELYK